MLKTKVTEDFPESLLFLCPVIAHNVAPYFAINITDNKNKQKIVSCYENNIEIHGFLYSGYFVTLITALEFKNKIKFN